MKFYISEKIIHIYKTSPLAPFFSGWAFLTFLISFNSYFGQGYLSVNSQNPCFPDIQNCKHWLKYIDLIPLPYGYSEAIFFAIMFGLIVYGAYSLYTKNYYTSYVILWTLFLTKVFLIVTNYGMGNFDYYDIFLIFIFLIYPGRVDLLKLAFVLLYFFASTIKIHAGWILGTYFSTLYYGLPLIPDSLIPVATNIVNIMQISGCLLLLHKNKKVSDYAFYFFVFFHLYSTILVNYRYPTTALLSLLVIFLVSRQEKQPRDYSFSRKNLAFYLVVTLLFIGQLLPYTIKGDNKFTLEGNNYGLYMFEANHQCISTVHSKNGTSTSFSYDARNRCDPYSYLYSIKKRYCKEDNQMISWVMDHSINGEPFQRMIDEGDACALTYKARERNTWIKDENTADVIGLPYKNVVLSRSGTDFSKFSEGSYLYPEFLSFSKPTEKTSLQKTLEGHLGEIKTIYWGLWMLTLIYMLYKGLTWPKK